MMAALPASIPAVVTYNGFFPLLRNTWNCEAFDLLIF
jgi:hypothetical protein